MDGIMKRGELSKCDKGDTRKTSWTRPWRDGRREREEGGGEEMEATEEDERESSSAPRAGAWLICLLGIICIYTYMYKQPFCLFLARYFPPALILQ